LQYIARAVETGSGTARGECPVLLALQVAENWIKTKVGFRAYVGG